MTKFNKIVRKDIHRKKLDVAKETTTVGDIAVYSGGALGAQGDLDPKQTKKRNKKRKKINKLGPVKGVPKEFTQMETLKLRDVLNMI